MKIGIITFWQTKDNYGQMLQNFALQCFLKKQGHSPFLIRYTHSEVEPSRLKKIKYCIKHLLLLDFKNCILKRKKIPEFNNDKLRDFANFKRNFLEMSELEYNSLRELKKNPPIADVYIVGSDQVWSKILNRYENRAFFLDFGKRTTKRIAYAASFAMPEYPEKYIRELNHQLKKFNAISVREFSGVEICRKAGVESQLVIDPTLLLDAQSYIKNFDLSSAKRDGVFIYCLNITHPSEIMFDSILDYATINHLSIYVTPSSGYVSAKELFNSVQYEYSTIPAWLNRILNSQIVITTSFHGVVFCILFNTPFVFVPLKGKFSRGNNRVLDLLSNLGIEDRVLGTKSLTSLMENDINWIDINKKLSHIRESSINFLNTKL